MAKFDLGKLKDAAQNALDKAKDAAQNAGAAIKTGVQNTTSAVQSGAQKAGSSIKTGAQNLSQKTVAAAQKVATTAATTAKKVVVGAENAASIALFAPLKPLAIVFLKRKNIVPAKTNEEIIGQVFNEIQKKSFGYGGADSFDYTTDQSEAGVYKYGFKITAQVVVVVITFLSTIFTSIKAKRDAKQALTKDESDILAQAPQIEQQLADAAAQAKQILADAEAQADAIQEQGANDAMGILSGKTGKITIVFVVVVIIVLLFVFLRKK